MALQILITPSLSQPLSGKSRLSREEFCEPGGHQSTTYGHLRAVMVPEQSQLVCRGTVFSLGTHLPGRTLTGLGVTENMTESQVLTIVSKDTQLRPLRSFKRKS